MPPSKFGLIQTSGMAVHNMPLVVCTGTFFCVKASAYRNQHDILYDISCQACCLGTAIQPCALNQQLRQDQEAGVGVPLNQVGCSDKGL